MEGKNVKQPDPFNTSLTADSALTPSHCVFRHGASWLALPAMAVREVLPQPEMVTVPATSETYAGLCHVRSEFVPVLNLDSVLSGNSHSNAEIMLILDDTDGPWAVLVDEVASLQFLEMSDAPETGPDDTQNGAVVGWATSGETVIQVLNQSRIRELAERELSAMWQSKALLAQQLEGLGACNTFVVS